MAQPTEPLSATYKSPTNDPFTLTSPIPTPPTSSIADKTSYLQALRDAVSKTQDEVNKELTARMEEDKARDAAANPGTASRPAIDEEKEEENYGEEVQEDDDA